MLKDMCYTITQPVGNCWPRWNPPMFLKALGPLTLLELLSIFNKSFPFLESGVSLLSSQFLELASQPAMQLHTIQSVLHHVLSSYLNASLQISITLQKQNNFSVAIVSNQTFIKEEAAKIKSCKSNQQLKMVSNESLCNNQSWSCST